MSKEFKRFLFNVARISTRELDEIPAVPEIQMNHEDTMILSQISMEFR